jgi:uncharacterized protein YidB (DUF937 family)
MRAQHTQERSPRFNKKWLVALAAPVVAVAGVGAASAQTADDDVSGDGAEEQAPDHAPHGRHRGPKAGAFAEAIGVEADELRTALMDGQTIAEVAAANGVDIDSVIADLVAEAQARAEEHDVADFDVDQLTEKLTSVVNGEVDFSERGPRGPKGPRGGSEAVETLLGLEGEEIRDALQAGSTLAEVAAEQGVDLDELVSTIVDDIETHLSEREGGLPEEFDVDTLTERVTERVTSDAPEDRPHGPGGRRGPRGPGPAPDEAV